MVLIKILTTIQLDDNLYLPGDILHLSEKEAEPVLKNGIGVQVERKVKIEVELKK